MYSACTTVQPQTEETISFTRLETDPEIVEVFVDGTQLPCSRLAAGIQFTVKGRGKEAMTVEAQVVDPGTRPSGYPEPEIPFESIRPTLP